MDRDERESVALKHPGEGLLLQIWMTDPPNLLVK